MSFFRGGRGHYALMPLLFLAFLLLAGPAMASIGDQLHSFKDCVEVRVPRPLASSVYTRQSDALRNLSPRHGTPQTNSHTHQVCERENCGPDAEHQTSIRRSPLPPPITNLTN